MASSAQHQLPSFRTLLDGLHRERSGLPATKLDLAPLAPDDETPNPPLDDPDEVDELAGDSEPDAAMESADDVQPLPPSAWVRDRLAATGSTYVPARRFSAPHITWSGGRPSSSTVTLERVTAAAARARPVDGAQDELMSDSDAESIPASASGQDLDPDTPAPAVSVSSPARAPSSGVQRQPQRRRAKSVGASVLAGSASPPEVHAQRAKPAKGNAPATGMPQEMVERLRKESLTDHEQRLLADQIKKQNKTGGTPRQLNIAMFVRSAWLDAAKRQEQPPNVPAEAWAEFMVYKDPRPLRQSLTPEQAAYWQHRCDILHAHHRSAFPDYVYAPKHLGYAEKMRRHEETNAKRMRLGLEPLPPPKKRGRPSKAQDPILAAPSSPTSAVPPSSHVRSHSLSSQTSQGHASSLSHLPPSSHTNHSPLPPRHPPHFYGPAPPISRGPHHLPGLDIPRTRPTTVPGEVSPTSSASDVESDG